MDKYGVVTEAETTKIAAKDGRPCPQCASRNVNYTGMTPHCPRCGTKPWEKEQNGNT
jgi:hypothetical protein